MSDTPAPRHLTTGRKVVLAVVVPIVLWLLLEVVAGVVLSRTSDGSPRRDLPTDDPEWLIHAKEAFKHGFFQPDDDVLWVPTPKYNQPPGPGSVYGDTPLVLNAFGHRSPPMSKDKPAGVRRVLIVGGSHPFGMWVNTPEAYSSVLSELLNAAGPHTWEVMNASSPGHTTFQGRRYIEHIGWEFSPDVVVFDLGMNDELPLSLDFAAPDHEVAAVPKWAKEVAETAGGSNVYRLLRKALAGSVGKARSSATIRVPLANRLENLTAVRDLGAQKGYQTLFMSQVGVESWKGPGAARCTFDPSQHGFEPSADICALFAGLGMEAGTHFVDPIHASPSGHRLIADGVFARMKELGWLD